MKTVIEMAREAGVPLGIKFVRGVVTECVTVELQRFTEIVCANAQRKQLTDEEIKAIVREVDAREGCVIEFARAIEAAHGIKEQP